MYKSLCLAVQVAHKMFGSLGQAEDGLQMDDFAACCAHVGVLHREQAQIFQTVAALIHCQNSFLILFPLVCHKTMENTKKIQQK